MQREEICSRGVSVAFLILTVRRRHACLHSLLRNPRLCLRFDRHLSFYRARNEALLVRSMIHFFKLFRRRLLVSGEFRLLPEDNARDRQFAFRVFLHEPNCFIDILVKHELLFARDSEERQHMAT
jgi:hypothetical protein